MADYIDQPTAWPTRKVTAMTLATPVAILASSIIVGFVPERFNIDMGNLSLLIEMLLSMAIAGATGYFTRERKQ